MTRSRLVSVKEKRELRQAVALIVLTVVILIGFVFWGLPAIAQLVGNTLIKNDTNGTIETLQVKPTVPILSDIPSATSSASLDITGFAQPGVDVFVVVNGVEESKVLVDDTGSFSFTSIPLVDGDNQIVAFAYNPTSKQESDTSKTYVVRRDMTKPNLVIDQPKTDTTFHTEMERIVEIKGSVDEEGSRIYVGERLAILSPELTFSVTYQLVDGEQDVVVRAVDPAGNETSETLKLRFEK